MREERPNPEELLLQIQKEEEKKIKKGKCSIFLGYAAGVGKTYAMLMEAHELVASQQGRRRRIYRAACQTGNDRHGRGVGDD